MGQNAPMMYARSDTIDISEINQVPYNKLMLHTVAYRQVIIGT